MPAAQPFRADLCGDRWMDNISSACAFRNKTIEKSQPQNQDHKSDILANHLRNEINCWKVQLHFKSVACYFWSKEYYYFL